MSNDNTASVKESDGQASSAGCRAQVFLAGTNLVQWQCARSTPTDSLFVLRETNLPRFCPGCGVGVA
jgi:hypothetical protein